MMGIQGRIKRMASRVSRGINAKQPICVPILEGSLLVGRRAFITGGTSGIGLAIAKAFVKHGADVVIAGRDGDRVNDALRMINAIGHMRAGGGCILDVRSPDVVKHAVQEASELLDGPVDLLVNSAGVNGGGSFGEITAESFDGVLETNVRGTVLVAQEIARDMIAAGVEGSILNIASSSSLRPASTPYSISKWAVRGLTLGMAKTLIKYGIVVNGLAPGPTATPMLLPNGLDNISKPRSPSGRYAMPEEIANMAVVLSSSLGRMIVGDTIYMTGGSGLITFDDIDGYEFVV